MLINALFRFLGISVKLLDLKTIEDYNNSKRCVASYLLTN